MSLETEQWLVGSVYTTRDGRYVRIQNPEPDGTRMFYVLRGFVVKDPTAVLESEVSGTPEVWGLNGNHISNPELDLMKLYEPDRRKYVYA